MATAGLQSNFAALTVPLHDHALAKSPPGSRARNLQIGAYRWCEPVADALAAAAAVQGVTFYAALRQHSLRAPQSGAFGATMLAMILVLGLFKLTGSYRTSRSMLSVRETADAISVCCITAILLLLFSVADLIHLQPSQSISIAALLFPLLLLEKYCMASLLLRWHERGIGVTTVAICGSGIACKRLYTTLVDSPKLGLWPAVVIDPSATAPGSVRESGYRIRRSSPVLAEKPNCETLKRWGVERILLIASSFNSAEMQAIISQAGRCGLPVQICGSDLVISSTAWQCADADGAILWNPTGTHSPRPYEYLKRAFDMFAALALITALLPLLAAIAVAIKLTSPGDVIFRQVRVGRRNRRFTMFKFRSMHTGACGDGFSPTQKLTLASLPLVASSARPVSTSCPSCSTFFAAKCRW
jgi:putative colanic acid biosynthesis UDP-glucose lipid carrier transferase